MPRVQPADDRRIGPRSEQSGEPRKGVGRAVRRGSSARRGASLFFDHREGLGYRRDDRSSCVPRLAEAAQEARRRRPSSEGERLPGLDLFFSHVHLHGGPAPVRRFLPEHVELISNGDIDPGKVFDLTLPLDQAPEGYRAMDERRAIKTLLTV
jgi:hypothetical protein